MNDLKFYCPKCGQHMVCDEQLAGSAVDCPECNCRMRVPRRQLKPAEQESLPTEYCPDCDRPLPAKAINCAACQWHRLAGRPATTVSKAEIFKSFNANLKPAHSRIDTGAINLVGGAFIGGYLWALAKPDAAVHYTLVASTFVLIVLIMAWVAAFRVSLGQGLATVFVPFYVLFFVYARSDSKLLKGMTGVAVIARLGALALNVPDEALRAN